MRYNESYFRTNNLHEDDGHQFEMGRVISHVFDRYQTFLDIGCGLGYLVGHLKNRGMDAVGVDISEYAWNNRSNNSVVRGDFRSVTDSFDVIILSRVLQCFTDIELRELAEWALDRCEVLLILNAAADGSEYEWTRSTQWYHRLFAEQGWYRDLELTNEVISNSDWDAIVLTPGIRDPESIYDPWLIRWDTCRTALVAHHNDTQSSRKLLETTASWGFDSQTIVVGNRPIIQAEVEDGLASGADYILLCDDQTEVSYDHWLAALIEFANPLVGAVVFGPRVHPRLIWDKYPIAIRNVSLRQSGGDLLRLADAGWSVSVIPYEKELVKQRLSTVVPEVTIITAFDDSKKDILFHYFGCLLSCDYPLDRIHLQWWDDSRESNVGEALREFLSVNGSRFGSLSINRAATEEWWIRTDDEYFPWEGIKYPISARVAALYNRAIHRVKTSHTLFWEPDTIPEETSFLSKLVERLVPGDACISGLYICRTEKKPLVWKITSLVPFEWQWLETMGVGVEVVDAVPHGLLLCNSDILHQVMMTTLANDPRDLRGPDLCFGRSLAWLGYVVKMHWEVKAKHYYPDGTFLQP